MSAYNKHRHSSLSRRRLGTALCDGTSMVLMLPFVSVQAPRLELETRSSSNNFPKHKEQLPQQLDQYRLR